MTVTAILAPSIRRGVLGRWDLHSWGCFGGENSASAKWAIRTKLMAWSSGQITHQSCPFRWMAEGWTAQDFSPLSLYIALLQGNNSHSSYAFISAWLVSSANSEPWTYASGSLLWGPHSFSSALWATTRHCKEVGVLGIVEQEWILAIAHVCLFTDETWSSSVQDLVNQ